MAGADIGTNFAGGCAVNIATAVVRQARYCYGFNELVKDMGDEQENLKATRDGTLRQLTEDKANCKEPLRDLQLQLKKAKDLIDKVDKLKEKAEAKKSCCHGVCPNWICRYVVGKNAKEKTEAMEKLNNELRPKLPFSRRKSLKFVPPSEDFILFKCTEHARNAILMALTDDKKIRIGLHGMAGCGKTSLLKEVRKQVEDSELYKTAFVPVSNTPNYQAIQDSIAAWIGLEFKTENNEGERAARLSMAFQSDQKYLVILDNVWQRLDFETIGIPVRENCKVLLSTRQRYIFDVMKFDAVIGLPLLTKEEAWELFGNHAGEIKDSLQQVAREIANECHKLPVAITAVASTLRGKEPCDWIEALATLKDRRRPLSIEKGLEDPYRCLKFSFDELKDEEEISLYLLCALFPRDSEIAIETLIRFAFGLGIFPDVDSYQRARSKVRRAINKLKNHSLLLQEEQHVKLHDMFHALATWEAKKRPQMITGPTQTAVALRGADMRDTNRLYYDCIKGFPDQLSCPELEILVVFDSGGGSSSGFPDNFFAEIKKLKVLAIKNISSTTKPDLRLPPSTDGLKKLRTLCLRGWTLNNLSVFEKLEMLDTIELLDCEMKELPEELANLNALKLLQVSNCKIGGNPHKVLARCVHLEELYFVGNHLQHMVQPVDKNYAEFFRQICSFKVLQKYHLEIGGSINTPEDDSSSKLISISNFDASCSTTKEAFQALSQTLEVLFFEKIQGYWESIIPGMIPIQGGCLEELKEFVICHCECVESLIDTTNDQLLQTRSIFAKLQKLRVEDIEGLGALCHGPPPPGLFEKLKELFIKDCSKLRSLFTTATAQKMVMLEGLQVIGCGELRHMIEVENNDDVSVGPALPNLKQISVKRCRNLRCILPTSFVNDFSQLECVEIEGAAKLQYVFGKDNHEKNQDQKQIVIDLSAVKTLKLINLPKIIRICPQNYDMKLPLDKTIVKGCPLLRGIDFDSEVSQQDGDEAMKQAKLLSISSGKDLRFRTRVRTPLKARYFYRFNAFLTDLRKENHLLMSKLQRIPVPAELLGDLRWQVMDASYLTDEVKMLVREAEGSKSYCHGVFRNWLSRYNVGKRLEQMKKKLKQFNERFTVRDSRKETYDEILAALQEDEIYMVGLYGTAGSGKTYLSREVCNEVNRLKLFDKLAFVVVSDPPDIRRIQEEIAHHLGFRLYDMDETVRAKALSMRINNGDKILIILDDMRQGFAFENVGIPLGKNCKVVLTSRLQHMCALIGCQKMVYLSMLTELEACILFQKHAGEVDDTLTDLALQILRECQGLPLSIIHVATTLKGKPEPFWREVLVRFKNPETDISSDMENAYLSLCLSIDCLGDDAARSLLFLCALFPEDSEIAREILIRFAIGLGIIQHIDSYETARVEVAVLIDKLIDSHLLLLIDEKRQYFRMYNLVRTVAFMSERKSQVIIGPEANLTTLIERGYMNDIRRLCCCDIKEYPNQLHCPQLEFLFISDDGECLSKLSDAFLFEMIELKVLTIIDTSIWTIPNLLLPHSMDGLKKLRTIRLRGWTLNNISILGKLEMLNTIELVYCAITELPEELAELRRLSLLEVSGCRIGRNPFEVLARCSQLQELYFVENSLPEMVSNDHSVARLLHQIGSSQVLRRYYLEIGSSINTLENDSITKFISINGFNIPTSAKEMKNMSKKLEVLFLENVQGDCKNIFPDMIPIERECTKELTEFLLHDSNDIECLIDTTNHPLYRDRTVFSRLLKLKIKTMKCFKALCRGPPPLDLFEKLEELFIVECSQLHCIVSVSKLNFCNLRHLQLEDCSKLTSIFTYSTARTMVLLEVLKVQDCVSLNHIIKDKEEDDENTPVGPIFPTLKQVCVKGCPRLEFIIPASFLCDLSQLESLEVEDNGMLKHVFGKYEHEEDQNQSEYNSWINLPVLKVLKLIDLPNITRICPQNYHIRRPDGAKLHIKRCPHLSIPPDPDSEAIQQVGGKSREQELELPAEQSSDMVVQSVEDVHLEDYKTEGIFQLIEPTINVESESLSLSCLQSLAMENLPNLRYISEGHKQLHNLRRLKIYKCGELKYIFSLRMMTYVSALRELIIEDCSQLEQIIKHEYYDGQYTGLFNDACNLQKIAVKSCPMLGWLFTVSTAKILRLMKTLKIEECSGMKVLLKGERTEANKRKEIVGEDGGQAIIPSLSFLSLKNLPELIHVCKGGKLKAVKGVMFPEPFNLSNLESLIIKSCPKLRSLFTVSTAKTLLWLSSLEITECSGLECVIKGKSKELAQGDAQEMLPKLNVLHLVKLPNLVIIHQGIKLQCELCSINDCPKLKQTLAEISNPDDLLREYNSSEEEEDYHDDDGEDMDRKEEHKEVEDAIQEDNSNVTEQDGTVQAAAEVHPHSQEFKTVDSQEDIQMQKFHPVDSLNLRESCTRIGKGSLHKDNGREESKVGISTPKLMDKQAQVEIDANVSKVQDAIEVHPQCNIADTQQGLQKQNFCSVRSMNLRESNMKMAKISFHEDSVPEESTVKTSSDVLIDKQTQIVTDPQLALQEHKASLLQPVQPTMLSPCSSITTTPPTPEAPTSALMKQHSIAEELADFHGLRRRACLLDEAFFDYPCLRNWKISQKSPRFCKRGYKSLTDMLEFLNSEKPNTMNESKRKKFGDLCLELESFGFDMEWLESIRQKVMDKVDDHDNKLKQLTQLKFHVSSLEDQLNGARAEMASLERDLSKLDNKLSVANKETQPKNLSQNCMSHGAYKMIEENIMQDDSKAMQEAVKSNPIVLAPPPPHQRKSKEGRIEKGQYINPTVAEIARKNDVFKEHSSQGSFTQCGRMDILDTMIGKPNHPNHIKGEQKIVGLTQYFGKNSRIFADHQLSDEFVAKIQEQVHQEIKLQLEPQLYQSLRTELMAELRDKMKFVFSNMQIRQLQQDHAPQDFLDLQSIKDNCNPPGVLALHGPSNPTLEVGQPNCLHLEVPKTRVIADAPLYTQGTTICCKKIEKDQARAMVMAVREGEEDVDVSFPIDENVKLDQDLKDVEKFSYLAQLRERHRTISKIDLKMPAGIVGEEKSYSFGMDYKDLEEFLSMKELDISWVQLAIIYFHNICTSTEKSRLYGFLCPVAIQTKHNELDKMMRYVSHTIRETKLPCYLAPIIESYHWSLCVPCPIENIVYWFDSVGHDPSSKMQDIFNKALETCYTTSGKHEVKNGPPSWIFLNCPQQRGNTECGYYIIRFMFEIIQSRCTKKFENIFNNKDSYTVKEIDFIRDLLAQQLLQEL